MVDSGFRTGAAGRQPDHFIVVDVFCLVPIPLSHGLSHSLKIACTQNFYGSTPPMRPSLVLQPSGEGGGELENAWDQKY